MNKVMLKKIEAITASSSRTDVIALNDELTAMEDKAQAKYDKELESIQEARSILNDNSNKVDDNE